MRGVGTLLAFGLAASPAFAGVCDGISLGDLGAQSADLYQFATSPVGLVLGLLVFATIYSRNHLLAVGACVLCALSAYAMFTGLFAEDPVEQEHCKPVPLLSLAYLAFLALCALWIAFLRRPRVTERLNTVGLSGDLDDVELLQAIEKVCGITIDDNEAKALRTVGELSDLVRAKTSGRTDFDPVWELVTQITRTHSGSRDPINPKTTFFAKDAEERR